MLQSWVDHTTERKQWRLRTFDSTKDGIESTLSVVRGMHRMLSYVPCEFDSTPDDLEAALPMAMVTGGQRPGRNTNTEEDTTLHLGNVNDAGAAMQAHMAKSETWRRVRCVTCCVPC